VWHIDTVGAVHPIYLYVAIDRRSRSVHLVVKDDETEASAIAFLREAATALPFRMTHVLTDNGSCFTPAFARACAELGVRWPGKSEQAVKWNSA
jgi:transposase-like protein